ncbi:ATP-binding protein [uncultured Oscillibacter sp.]|uniref:sensor histidine kinase n=1 Tax=uncultured Oscillibacter sp. TaxID=876091 RepID=UPI002806406D|nr:ATP-binding protein [uncultured Oscillibacter sp.]
MRMRIARIAKRLHNKFRGLYWRQMFVTVGMVLLTLFLLGASFFSLSYSYARGREDEELAAQARVVGQLSVSYLENGRYLDMEELQHEQDFQNLASFAATVSEVDFLICDVKGHVLLSTDAALSGLVVTMPEDMTEEVLEKGITSSRTDVDGLYPNKRFVVGVPAVGETSQEPVGVIYAVSVTTSLENMWSGFIGLFFMTAFVVLMISFMASSITTMRQIQPIREMVKATRRYAEGDFDIRMNDYGRDDELGELAASFNNMAESLQQTERQRREFIANISHELKTPMTTIAGYTDGILDGTIPPENERQYLQIISDESRRLSRLVRRMLDVSQLQAIDPLREGKHFDICESMRRVLISMEKKITDRNLDVDADIPEEPILVLGDKDMITQVIYNLLENATKFATEGSTLYLGVTTIDGKARVTVRNVGETIPAGELPLLFERFHKSDKSRSEDKDGYGLGLYIVKTILEQHKEKISVTSEDGVTTFSFSLATE